MRLEQRLGYAHKGVERLLVGADIARGARIVGRISGDSTVAYAWAFARAVEAALGWTPPPRAVLLRAVMAELERLAHHISDVGAICNDASVLTIHARCALQREDVLAVAAACFGHRLMMDRVVPGGVATDLSAEGVGKICALAARFEETRAEILRVYDSLPSLQDRTITVGKDTYDLPLPLGANALRRDLDPEMASECCRLMRDSIQYAIDHREEALNYALQFARDMDPALAEKFVGMYVNHYTVDCGEIVPKAAQKLLDMGYEAGLIPHRVQVEFVR